MWSVLLGVSACPGFGYRGRFFLSVLCYLLLQFFGGWWAQDAGGRPTLMGEFGFRDKAERYSQTYHHLIQGRILQTEKIYATLLAYMSQISLIRLYYHVDFIGCSYQSALAMSSLHCQSDMMFFLQPLRDQLKFGVQVMQGNVGGQCQILHLHGT